MKTHILIPLLLIGTGIMLYLALRKAKPEHEDLAPETLPIIPK